MYFVPDGTERCGFYECKDCGSRFLSVQIGPTLICPYCGEEVDMEIDGSVAPYAALSSIVFTPNESIEALKYFAFSMK